MTRKQNSSTGFSLIEILLAAALFLLLISGIALLSIHNLVVEQQSVNYLRAVSLAEQGREAVRYIRKAGFETIDPIADGGITQNDQGEFQLNSIPDTFGMFERRVSIGILDDETKQVDVTVTWNNDLANNSSITLTDYLYYWEQPY